MRTYTTTATVQDGKLVLVLPNDFREHQNLTVAVFETQTLAPPNTDDAVFSAWLDSIAGSAKGPKLEIESLRREYLYDDNPTES